VRAGNFLEELGLLGITIKTLITALTFQIRNFMPIKDDYSFCGSSFYFNRNKNLPKIQLSIIRQDHQVFAEIQNMLFLRHSIKTINQISKNE